jgi:hypothetical protein
MQGEKGYEDYLCSQTGYRNDIDDSDDDVAMLDGATLLQIKEEIEGSPQRNINPISASHHKKNWRRHKHPRAM